MSFPLTRFERRAAHAAFDTIFPGPARGSLPLGMLDMELDRFLDETLAAVPLEVSIGLRLAFLVLALAPLFVLRRFATLMSLGVDDREHVIERVYDSRSYVLRSTVVGLKAIGALFYCGDRRVRPIIVGAESAGPVTHRDGALVALRKRPSSEGVEDVRRIA